MDVDFDETLYADWRFRKIVKQIEEFEQDLDDDHETTVHFVGFGEMTITSIGYQNPDLLYFYGFIGGKQAEIIQHTSQINLLLLSAAKHDPDGPPYRLGSVLSDDE